MQTQTAQEPQRRNSPGKVAQSYCPGPLAVWIGSRHKAGRSWQQVADDITLLTEGRVRVTRAAVRNWALDQ